jgi:hypothetical protein
MSRRRNKIQSNQPTNEKAINQNVGSNKKAGSRLKKAGSQLTENQDEESRLFRG